MPYKKYEKLEALDMKNDQAKNQQSTPKYRDTVFRTLYRDEELALELCNAITGSNYVAGTPVGVYDLEGTLAQRYNDVAIAVDDKLLLMIEHQSTINENMPLRLLQYCVDVLFARFVENEQLYPKKIHKIPTPTFFVLYNGESPLKKTTLRLSDAFETNAPENGMELIVHVVDINYSSESIVLQKSDSLRGYAILVEQIRKFMREGYTRDTAIRKAIDYCIKNDILKSFLKENYERVIEMFNRDHDQEAEYRAIRKEEREAGIAEGIQQGIEQGLIEVAQKMIQHNDHIDEIIKLTGLSTEIIQKLQAGD